MNNLSLDIKSVKFLGSKERIIVAGNNPSTNIQIVYSNIDENEKNLLKNHANIYLPGQFSALELCGIPRLSKTFAAVATTHNNDSNGSISLIDVETLLNSASLTLLQGTLLKNFSTFSSLAFQPDLELLAAATESGYVIFFDLSTGCEINRIKVDPSGINKIKFIKTGQLLTIGNSTKNAIKIWDLLDKKINTTNSSMILNKNFNNHDPIIKKNKSKTLVRYTAVDSDITQDYVATGCSDGSVVIFDLRSSNNSLEFSIHSSASIVFLL